MIAVMMLKKQALDAFLLPNVCNITVVHAVVAGGIIVHDEDDYILLVLDDEWISSVSLQVHRPFC
jgi:hypothetical protein